MDVLIVEPEAALADVWGRHIARCGGQVARVATAEAAIAHLGAHAPAVIVVDLRLPEGGALAVADYASYRRPAARVVFVTTASFFADGSIFRYSANAAACLGTDVAPADLAAVVAWHGRAA